jgi:hypothetical protein
MTDPGADPTPHPSPDRAKTGLARLLYGLAAAPTAWVAGQLVNAGLAQEACFPGTEPLANPAVAGLHLIQTVVLLISVLVCASAAIVALGAWQATRTEHSGDQQELLSIGEGRSRFLAFAGVLTSAGFLLGTLFSVPALIFIPAC